MKIKQQNHFNHMWPTAILLLVFVAGLFLYVSKKSHVPQIVPTETSNPGTVVNEEYVGGVYINHTHGFKFNYLSEVFSEKGTWDGNSKIFYTLNNRFPQLSVSVWPVDFLGDFYNSCYSTSNGSRIASVNKRPNLTGIKSQKLYNRGKICVSETTPEGDGEYSEGWTYVLSVPSSQNDEIISINLSTSSLKEHYSLTNKFDILVKSFELLEN